MFYQTPTLQKKKLHFSVHLGHTVRNFLLSSLGQTVLSWAIFRPHVSFVLVCILIFYFDFVPDPTLPGHGGHHLEISGANHMAGQWGDWG